MPKQKHRNKPRKKIKRKRKSKLNFKNNEKRNNKKKSKLNKFQRQMKNQKKHNKLLQIQKHKIIKSKIILLLLKEMEGELKNSFGHKHYKILKCLYSFHIIRKKIKSKLILE